MELLKYCPGPRDLVFVLGSPLLCPEGRVDLEYFHGMGGVSLVITLRNNFWTTHTFTIELFGYDTGFIIKEMDNCSCTIGFDNMDCATSFEDTIELDLINIVTVLNVQVREDDTW